MHAATYRVDELVWTREHRGTHRGGGGCVEVQQAADVRPGRVDGGVQAEAVRVHAQGGAATVHHFPHNVHLHLGNRQGYLPCSRSLSLANHE